MISLQAIQTENRQLLTACRFTSSVTASRLHALLAQVTAYRAASAATGVPLALLAALNERESSTDMHTYLGNGDSLVRRTVHVPRGRGPFIGPDAWQRGAIDALHLDGLDSFTGQWDWALALAAAERYNGFGYRAKGIHTPYVWAGTSLYKQGKYVSDGKFDSSAVEHNPGVALLLSALETCGAEWTIPGRMAGAIPAPAPVPAEYAGHPVHGVEWVQYSLNSLMHAGLAVDGSYGARTRAAIREFQQLHGLDVDGIAGPDTIGELESAMDKNLGHIVPAVQAARMELRGPQAAQKRPVSVADNVARRNSPPPQPDNVARRNTLGAEGVTDAQLAALVEGLYRHPGAAPVTWDAQSEPDASVCWAIRAIGDIAVLVFRGSTTFKDWVQDFEAWACPADAGGGFGPVHPGFNEGMQYALGTMPLARMHDSKLLITGHSLGAARAWIAAAAIKQRPCGVELAGCVGFGSPRPGFQQLAAILKDVPGRNYRNSGGWGQTDLITSLPFHIGSQGYVPAQPYADVTVRPSVSDPWGPFAWHRMGYYQDAMYKASHISNVWR